MKHVLITGANGGIGSALCRKLCREGVRVTGIVRRNESVKELSEKFPGLFTCIEFDLMNVDALPGLIADIIGQGGPIDGFVHCAGFDIMKPLSLTKVKDIQDLWTIHALVPMHMVTLLNKKKNMMPGASIVLISSVSAHEGAMGHTAYASAKGAIEGFLPSAAAELSRRQIRLNVVAFGPIKTKMSEGWMNKLGEEGKEHLLSTYPLGLGKVEDASELIKFLLSDKSDWISGQRIIADGGHLSRPV